MPIVARLAPTLALLLCALSATTGALAADVPSDPGHAMASDAAHRPAGIAWHDGDVDSAFERARRERRPVFVYWGAVWCPPCNQLKATLFNRADFQERAKLFVPVYIDGDAPGAQQLGTRFKVRGYPTTIVLRPDGSEITRLPGEVDPQRYLDVLAAALAATHPVQTLRDDALSARRALSADEWRLLAYYSWETDEQQLAPKGETAALVARLAEACPRAHAALRDRLVLKALTLRAAMPGATPAPTATAAAPATPPAASARTTAPPPADLTTRATVHRVLADAAQARANFDLLVYGADDAVAWLGGSDARERTTWTQAWDRALARLADDPSLSQADRLAAFDARIGLARRSDAKAALPEALVAAARVAAVRADRAARTPAERQAVISAAAEVLADAGLFDASDRLLRDELARSPAPYYFMLGLADNARKRGDKTQALAWYAQAHDAAQGPATRLQWGATHVRALTELAPDDAPTIERAAAAVLGEIEPVPASFEGRNLAVLQRLGTRLSDWGRGPAHTEAWSRVRAQWQALCERLPAQTPQRAACAAPL